MNEQPITQAEWERLITEWMISCGWEKYMDDETTLGFTISEGERTWSRDYDKTTRRFIHMEDTWRVNLKPTRGDKMDRVFIVVVMSGEDFTEIGPAFSTYDKAHADMVNRQQELGKTYDVIIEERDVI